MPNHIKNRIAIKATGEMLQQVIERFSTFHEKKIMRTYDDSSITCQDESGNTKGWYNETTNKFTFATKEREMIDGFPDGISYKYEPEWLQFPDFKKVIEMPDSLDCESGSFGDNARALLFGNQQKYSIKSQMELQEWFSSLTEENQKKAALLGIQYENNFRNYGHTTWYDWSVENWGTKWNSYSCNKEIEDTFTFETAWSGVPIIMEVISKTFPDVEFYYEYADEDTGSGNCGIMNYKNGLVHEYHPESQSIEAYDLAFKLRPNYKEDYHLVDGSYEYKEDDSDNLEEETTSRFPVDDEQPEDNINF